MKKIDSEASNPYAYNRFEWGSDGYVGKLNTVDSFGATLSNPINVSESHLKANA
jgi:hypothetical protein